MLMRRSAAMKCDICYAELRVLMMLNFHATLLALMMRHYIYFTPLRFYF